MVNDYRTCIIAINSEAIPKIETFLRTYSFLEITSDATDSSNCLWDFPTTIDSDHINVRKDVVWFSARGYLSSRFLKVLAVDVDSDVNFGIYRLGSPVMTIGEASTSGKLTEFASIKVGECDGDYCIVESELEENIRKPNK